MDGFNSKEDALDILILDQIEEAADLDHLLDMMTAIKQQILLRRAMKKESNVCRLKDNQEELP